MAASDERLICASADLVDGGDGVRFTIAYDGAEMPAFAVRYASRVRAYINRCTHNNTQLDWEPRRFFHADKRFLICATHGALYAPDSGACVGGPCRGGLAKLQVIEKNNAVYLTSSNAAEPLRDRR